MLTLLASALAWLRKVNPLVFVITGLAFAAWLGWHRADHWRDEAAKRSQVIATMQAEAKRADRTSTIIAGAADVSHTTTLGSNRAATRAYADAHRVRLPTATGSGADHGAPLSADPAAIPFVVTISEPDLGTCSDDHAYAVSAYDWTQSLIAAGLAKPEKPQ